MTCAHSWGSQVLPPSRVPASELSEIKLSVDGGKGSAGAAASASSAVPRGPSGASGGGAGSAPPAAAAPAGGDEEGGPRRSSLAFCLWAGNVCATLPVVRVHLVSPPCSCVQMAIGSIVFLVPCGLAAVLWGTSAHVTARHHGSVGLGVFAWVVAAIVGLMEFYLGGQEPLMGVCALASCHFDSLFLTRFLVRSTRGASLQSCPFVESSTVSLVCPSCSPPPLSWPAVRWCVCVPFLAIVWVPPPLCGVPPCCFM